LVPSRKRLAVPNCFCAVLNAAPLLAVKVLGVLVGITGSPATYLAKLFNLAIPKGITSP
jgi:hypothetical protein